MDENSYVGINEPVNVRRNILQAVREVLHDLQVYEDVAILKKRRAELQVELGYDIAELRKLLDNLRQKLPAVAKKKTNQKKVMSELEKELSEVEKELGTLK